MQEHINDFKERIKYEKKYTDPKQKEMHDKLMSLLDEYERNNSYENREYLCYLTAAIFLTYKKLYPQLSIYIPFRTKSDASFIKNVQKEAFDAISENGFDDSAIVSDISGIRIVLDNINFSRPSKGRTDLLFNDPEIAELMKKSQADFSFLDEINDFLQASIHTGKRYYELRKELLKRIIEITPKEFKEERRPNPSYTTLYNAVCYQYDYFVENDSFPTDISDSEITELKDFSNDLRSRIHDPLQFAILRKTLPIVFDEPLIKNVLKAKYTYSKESLKANGFQAIYYSFDTPFGPIEVQGQSNKAHYTSTKGSAFHSGIPGKSINVKDFFELVDPDDAHELSYYLDELDSFSADLMISPYEIPEFETEEEKTEFFKTPVGIAYLKSEKYREMMKHIKIKSQITVFPSSIPSDVYPSKDSTEINQKRLIELIRNGVIYPSTSINPVKIDADEYLFSTALSVSPYMNVCSSGHTSFTNAEIHHKKIIGEFSEVLRKKDSNTCLRDILIRRLESLIEKNYFLDISDSTDSKIISQLKKVKEHDEISTRLPKDISVKNILLYAEKLRAIEKEDHESSISD